MPERNPRHTNDKMPSTRLVVAVPEVAVGAPPYAGAPYGPGCPY